MTDIFKMAAAIVKETFTHPNKVSTIKVEKGEVHVDRKLPGRSASSHV